jgi:hypothetical protein
MIDPKREEARLVRRIAHLRMLPRHTNDARIAVALDELIAAADSDCRRNSDCRVDASPQAQSHAALIVRQRACGIERRSAWAYLRVPRLRPAPPRTPAAAVASTICTMLSRKLAGLEGMAANDLSSRCAPIRPSHFKGLGVVSTMLRFRLVPGCVFAAIKQIRH